jgi:hypothetical protein
MLYVRFPLSLRNVEDLLHERGVGAGITRFATVAKYNVRIRRPRLFGAAVLGNAQPSQMLPSLELHRLPPQNHRGPYRSDQMICDALPFSPK